MLPFGIFRIGIRQFFRHRNLVIKGTQRFLVISQCVLDVGYLVIANGKAACSPRLFGSAAANSCMMARPSLNDESAPRASPRLL